MSWPLSQDYNEAIQTPTNFTDPDLRRGQVAVNALGLPMPYSGNFADVYQVQCPDGNRWAVKCFTREVKGLRERYQEISAHLRQAKLPFTVDFTYLEQGIRVAGRWFPVLKMQWVEGLTLHQFVAQSADKPAMLQALALIWSRVARHLRASSTAHADLQHGNVLLVPGAGANSLALKLIDYDGMFVPSLAGQPSGEVGHPAYQHPQRAQKGTYSLEVDRFPLLLVATALQALKVGGRALWDRFDNGDNLLFQEADLLNPQQSPLFEELTRLGDPLVAELVTHVRTALKGGLESAPLLEEVLPEAAPAAAPPAPAIPSGAVRSAGKVSSPARQAGGRSAGETWNLDEPESIVTDPSRRVRSGRKEKGAGGIPPLAWIGAAAGVVLVLVGTVAGIILMRGKGADTSNPRPDLADTRTGEEKGGRKPPKDTPGTTDKTPVRSEDEPPEKQEPKNKEPEPGPKPKPAEPAEIDPDPAGPIGEVRRFQGHTQPIRRLSVSPDGRRLLTAGLDNTIRLWDVATGKELRQWPGHSGEAVMSVAFLPDGRRALSAGRDKLIRLWDLEKDREIRSYPIHTQPVAHVAVTPDGQVAASSGDESTVFLWNVDTGKVLHRLEGIARGAETLAFSRDGKFLVTGSKVGEIRLWNVEKGTEVQAFKGDQGWIYGLALSLDGRFLYSASIDNTLRMWEVDNGREVRRFEGLSKTSNQLGALALSGDGSRILAGGKDGSVTLEEAATGKWLYRFEGDKQGVFDLAFSPDDHYAYAAGWDKAVRMFRLPAPGYAPPPPDKPIVARKPDEKPPVPDEAALAEAEKEVKEVYKEVFNRKKDWQGAAEQLLKEGSNTRDKPAERYVLFREARNLALKANDITLALRVAEEMANHFAVSRLGEKAATLELASRQITNRPTRLRLAAQALVLADQAVEEAEDFTNAERFARSAQASAGSFTVQPLAVTVKQRLTEMSELRKGYEAIEASVRTLADKPEDPEANLAVGRFYALTKGDWERALPLLARGSDEQLRALAVQDLAVPARAREAEELGDRYNTLAGRESGPAKTNLLFRGWHWYRIALGKAPGAERTRVEKKLSVLEKMLPGSRPVVLAARYGAFSGWADVTDKVRELVAEAKGQKLSFRADLPVFEIRDPMFGENKTLVVVYRYRGGIHLSTKGSDTPTMIPAPPGEPETAPARPAAGQELVFLFARYGYQSTFADIASKLQAGVKGAAFVARPGDFALGDPVPFKRKAVVIVYRLGGRIHLSVTPESNTELSLGAAPTRP
jgi:hypothetical protein